MIAMRTVDCRRSRDRSSRSCRHGGRHASRPRRRDGRIPLRRHPVRACRDSRSPTSGPSFLGTLLSPALTVAMLGAIESLMSAVVADRMTRRSPRPERGARRAGRRQRRLAAVRRPARDRRHRANGDQHPLGRADAGGGDDPRRDAACVLLVAARSRGTCRWRSSRRSFSSSPWNMGEWREIPELLKLTRTDISVWAVTFALTVLRRPDRCRRSRHGPRGAVCSSAASR